MYFNTNMNKQKKISQITLFKNYMSCKGIYLHNMKRIYTFHKATVNYGCGALHENRGFSAIMIKYICAATNFS